MRATETLELDEVRILAEFYVPKIAQWVGNMSEEWGPAHELGHLLIARPGHVHKADFGLAPSHIVYPNFKQKLYEVAASVVSTWILVACGGNGVKLARYTWKEGLPGFMMRKKWVGLKPIAYQLLAKRRITPETVRNEITLEGACRRARGLA